MRALLALLVLLLLPVFGAHAQRDPSGVKGLFLLTDYPSQTVRTGEVTTIRVKVTNAGLLPQPLALALNGIPAGWKIDLLGGGQPVGAVMVGVNQDVTVQLRIELPMNTPPGTQTIVLTAKGQMGQQASLPLTLTVGTETPARLSLKSRPPSLRGTPRSAFEYTLTVGNDSGKDLTVALAAQGPAKFQSSFTEGSGTNEISAIEIEAGQTKDIMLKVTPPRDMKAGDYPVLVRVAAEGATADTRVTLQVSGQGRLALSTSDGRLSGEAEAGKASTYALVLSNDGTAPLDEVELSGSVPAGWKIEFDPMSIVSIAPSDKKEVRVVVTPADKATAGDYMASFRAAARGEQAAADFRVTVTTSTLWGTVGIGIIAVALLVLLGAVTRFAAARRGR